MSPWVKWSWWGDNGGGTRWLCRVFSWARATAWGLMSTPWTDKRNNGGEVVVRRCCKRE